MTKKTVLGPEVSHLLSNLSDHGTQHLGEVRNDLVQADVLISEAIEKLGHSFQAIHDAVAAQQEIIEALAADAALAPQLASRLAALKADVAREVGAAVTAMQFQDMTSQLIARAVQRVDGIAGLLDSAGAGSAALAQEERAEPISARLHEMNLALESQSARLDGMLLKSVRQTHLESGDVELF
ncbi:hypothetical protein [Noviherbaspirillum humi]|nr:hypothetical protein [Noviherbaspirillum humi]